MTVYLDLIFFQNMIMGYLLLYLIKTDLYPGISLRRMMIGSMLSSITYIFWYSMGMQINRQMTLFSACFFMNCIFLLTFQIPTFSMYKQTIEKAIEYICLMGGACLLFREGSCFREAWNDNGCFLSTGIMTGFTILYTGWKKKLRKRKHFEAMIYDVEIQRHSKTILRQGFYDSGNQLVSQITGRGICVVPFEQMKELLDENEKELLEEMMNVDAPSWKLIMNTMKEKIFVIQYSTVGREHGWMPGILAEHIIVRNNDKILVDTSGMLGICAQKISKDEKFNVLLPADIFRSSVETPVSSQEEYTDNKR